MSSHGVPAFKALSNALDDTVNVLGVVNFAPTPPLHLFQSCAGVVVPALVVPIYPAGVVGRPGELADVVGKFAEAQLAFAQRLLAGRYYSFGALAFGDVLRNHIDPDDFSVERSSKDANL